MFLEEQIDVAEEQKSRLTNWTIYFT